MKKKQCELLSSSTFSHRQLLNVYQIERNAGDFKIHVAIAGSRLDITLK